MIKKFSHHWLCNDLPFDFIVENNSTWNFHNVCFQHKELQYLVLFDSDKGPMVLLHENSVLVNFQINNKYKETTKILYNFIKKKFKEVQDKEFRFHEIRDVNEAEFALGYKCDDNVLRNTLTNLEKQNQYYMTNLELATNVRETHNSENLRKRNYSCKQRPTSQYIAMSSRNFSKVTKTAKLGPHVGFSFTKRDMIFVEDNAINGRPVTAIKNTEGIFRPSSPLSKSSTVFRPKSTYRSKINSQQITTESSSPRDFKSKKYNHELTEGQGITNVFKERVLPKNYTLDDLKKFVEENDTKTKDYLNFIDKDKLDEQNLIDYYKTQRRNITHKLVEWGKTTEKSNNKLTDIKIFSRKIENNSPKSFRTKTFRINTAKPSYISMKDDKELNDSLSKILIDEENNKNEKNKETMNVFSMLFPYVKQEEMPKKITRHVHKFPNQLDNGNRI